jgi:hypothetical protein
VPGDPALLPPTLAWPAPAGAAPPLAPAAELAEPLTLLVPEPLIVFAPAAPALSSDAPSTAPRLLQAAAQTTRAASPAIVIANDNFMLLPVDADSECPARCSILLRKILQTRATKISKYDDPRADLADNTHRSRI